jgi:hypothetical protein
MALPKPVEYDQNLSVRKSVIVLRDLGNLEQDKSLDILQLFEAQATIFSNVATNYTVDEILDLPTATYIEFKDQVLLLLQGKSPNGQ